MSKSAPTITINPSKRVELEFDVVVQGTDDKDPPSVRFVIEDETFDRTFKCSRSDNGKHTWVANLPALTDLVKESYKFRVEVVIDGYFFTPAAGSMTLVQDPTVKFQSASSKPSVTTSFTVKQEDDKPANEDTPNKEKQKIDESEITGQYAPTNALLVPEYEPIVPKARVSRSSEPKMRISDLGTPVPGESPVNEPDGIDYDPRSVAERIVRDQVGNVKMPEKQGTLFSRGRDGKPVIAGLDTPELNRERQEKAARVKAILNPT